MNITVIGTGYVGLSTGFVCLKLVIMSFVLMLNEQKVNLLKAGISPIYEPGLQPLLQKNTSANRLLFTASHKDGLKYAEIIILAVGTPQHDDGSADLSYLIQAAKDLAPHLKNNRIIVIKSTVPVGTNDFIKDIISKHLPENISFAMVSNPEFLRQGSAIKDTMQPDRIVLGSNNDIAAKKIQKMYRPLNVPIILTNIKSAEMIKYASNAFLATKISFINEIANLCEAVGADVEDVAFGMGKDNRIGEAFLLAGIGYGGSCFPKDTKALLHMANANGIVFSQRMKR